MLNVDERSHCVPVKGNYIDFTCCDSSALSALCRKQIRMAVVRNRRGTHSNLLSQYSLNRRHWQSHKYLLYHDVSNDPLQVNEPFEN